jgi:hypothetical protein
LNSYFWSFAIVHEVAGQPRGRDSMAWLPSLAHIRYRKIGVRAEGLELGLPGEQSSLFRLASFAP